MGNGKRLDLGGVHIHESATIGVLFAGGRVIPRAVQIGTQLETIAGISREWEGAHRGTRLLYYQVESATGHTLKLCFNVGELAWMVEEVSQVEH